MDDKTKQRYLQNPHITLTKALRKALGITSEDLKEARREPMTIEGAEPLPTVKEVLRRKRHDDKD